VVERENGNGGGGPGPDLPDVPPER
jgi:hypothetical protein